MGLGDIGGEPAGDEERGEECRRRPGRGWWAVAGRVSSTSSQRESVMRTDPIRLSVLAILLVAGACGEESAGAGDAGARDAGLERPDAPGPGLDASVLDDAGPPLDAGFDADAGFDPDAACVATVAEATHRTRPVDIVFLIDNSASMNDEIEAVQRNINQSFADIINASGVDYRVIVVGLHGPSTSTADGLCRICIEPPLSSTACNPMPSQPGINPPSFFHYNVELRSHDSVCKFLRAYATADTPFGLAPNGLQEWLRPEAFKHFVELSDDGLMCTPPSAPRIDDLDSIEDGEAAAASFDALLLASSAAQFGTPAARNYTWHSIINVAAKADPTQAYGPEEPMTLDKCDTWTFGGPGTGYQALSRLTGGLRFPICEKSSYDAVFQEIARGVIEGADVECEYPVPEPPPGRQLDLSTVVVGYSPSSGETRELFEQVAGPADCAAGRFYIAEEVIKLCPAACATVQADDGAKVEILYGCKVELN